MTIDLDPTDWRILEALQEDARTTFAALGRQVGLSSPAVAERVRRLEADGVLRGYRAEVDLAAVGLPIQALTRVRFPSGDATPFHQALRARPEVVQCHHVTGEDCYVVTIAARSMAHLEQVTADLARFGAVATSVVYSTPIRHRTVTPDTVGAAGDPTARVPARP